MESHNYTEKKKKRFRNKSYLKLRNESGTEIIYDSTQTNFSRYVESSVATPERVRSQIILLEENFQDWWQFNPQGLERAEQYVPSSARAYLTHFV